MDILLNHSIDNLLDAPGEVAESLCNDLYVDYLVAKGFVQSAALEAAMRRHMRGQFLPGVDWRASYSDRAVTTLESASGWFESSCSTPSIVATMLEALELKGGESILEIGAGTGYTAALMAAMSPKARVRTIEVIPEVAAESAARLQAMGLGHIECVCGDGFQECPQERRYDRIIMACGATELSRHWFSLLNDDGILIIPLGNAILSLRKQGDQLCGRPLIIADFIALRSVGTPVHRWEVTAIDDEQNSQVGLSWSGWERGSRALIDILGQDMHEAVACPEIPSQCLAAVQFLLAAREPNRWFQMATRQNGWGFGLVDEASGEAFLVHLSEEFTFRHYAGRALEPVIQIWGEGDLVEELYRIFDELGDAGWPALNELQVAIRPSDGVQDPSKPLAAQDWKIELPTPSPS